MKWTIPGTVLKGETEAAEHIRQQMESMFLGGGMVLSQVCSVTGLEPYAVQNWVKRGFLTPPQAKRYTLRQLCRIININMLKGVLPMAQLCGMLTYINGSLSDESDDLIDDSQLYFMFVKLAARAREIDRSGRWLDAVDKVLEGYQEPIPGAKERIAKVLRIMIISFIAARMKDQAEELMGQLVVES